LLMIACRYIERMRVRAHVQVAAAWRGWWQRKKYLAGLRRQFARERRLGVNVVCRNWAAHLVRAVMRIGGRRMMRGGVVAKVRGGRGGEGCCV